MDFQCPIYPRPDETLLVMKTVVRLLFSHTNQVIYIGHHQTGTHKSKYLFQTQPLKELFDALVSARRKHFLYKYKLLPARKVLLTFYHSDSLPHPFHNFSIIGILGPCLQSHLSLNSSCGITTLTVQ